MIILSTVMSESLLLLRYWLIAGLSITEREGMWLWWLVACGVCAKLFTALVAVLASDVCIVIDNISGSFHLLVAS